MNSQFIDSSKRTKTELEDGNVFAPRFDAQGLITAIAADADDNTILMVAYMNAQALQLTLETGIAHYWSRSRNALWKKGETSGHTQTLVEMRTDCDQDVIFMKVRTGDTGANCHTGRKSCFYRIVETNAKGEISLSFDESDTPRFNPNDVYK